MFLSGTMTGFFISVYFEVIDHNKCSEHVTMHSYKFFFGAEDFFGHTHSMFPCKFPDQGSNPSHSSDPRHYSDNARYLTR